MKMKGISNFDFLEILPPSSNELKVKLIEIMENSKKLSVVIKGLNRETGFFEIELKGTFKKSKK